MMKEHKHREFESPELKSYEWHTSCTGLHGVKIETERRRWLILFGFSLLKYLELFEHTW